jgi:anti-sigma B factor antagonist
MVAFQQLSDLSPQDMIDVNVDTTGDITIIEMVGELDSVTAPAVQEQIIPLAKQGYKIILDMTGVTYMSSAGLRILLLMYRTINEHVGTIIIAGLNDDVRDVMSITGFLEFFTIVDTREEAFQKLR